MNKFFFMFCLLSFVGLNAQQSDPVLDSLLKITDSAILHAKIAKLEGSSEKDLNILASYYNSKRNFSKAETVYQKAAERFPTSFLAFHAALGNLKREESARKRRHMFADIKKKFPHHAHEVDFQFAAANMALKSIEEKNLDDVLFYLKSIDLPSMYAPLTKGISTIDPKKAEKLLENYIKTHSKPSNNGILTSYVHVLVLNGKRDKAFPIAKELYPNSRKSLEFVTNYGKILQSRGEYQELVKVYENALLDGQLTKEIKNGLLAAYLRQGINGDEAIKGIMEQYRKKLKTEMAQKMINKPSPAFVLKDEKDRDVSLSELKGKILVLDFWATWCVPCKKSFPAMQMAVNRYNEDNNVKFLFIHTWDRGSDNPLQDASNYLDQNNYAFDLYMDYKDSATGKHPVVTSFGVTGIPTKFLIDGNGNIRFKIDGFFGVDEAATEEVIAMIELVKDYQ